LPAKRHFKIRKGHNFLLHNHKNNNKIIVVVLTIPMPFK